MRPNDHERYIEQQLREIRKDIEVIRNLFLEKTHDIEKEILTMKVRAGIFASVLGSLGGALMGLGMVFVEKLFK